MRRPIARLSKVGSQLGGGWFPFGPEMVPLDLGAGHPCLGGLSLLCNVGILRLAHMQVHATRHHPLPLPVPPPPFCVSDVNMYGPSLAQWSIGHWRPCSCPALLRAHIPGGHHNHEMQSPLLSVTPLQSALHVARHNPTARFSLLFPLRDECRTRFTLDYVVCLLASCRAAPRQHTSCSAVPAAPLPTIAAPSIMTRTTPHSTPSRLADRMPYRLVVTRCLY